MSKLRQKNCLIIGKKTIRGRKKSLLLQVILYGYFVEQMLVLEYKGEGWYEKIKLQQDEYPKETRYGF